TVAHRLARPRDGCREHAVAREHGGRDVERPVVDDERDVLRARGLEPGRDAGGAEPLRGGDGHGATPSVVRPAVCGRPSAMFMDCTAAPAVPLTRLSIAVTVTTRPAAWSTATWTSAVFAPRVIAVVGHWPAGSTRTNGSPAYASSHAWRTRASSAAGSRRAASSARRAVTVARMPRDIGTRVGVKEMLTSGAPAARRFCAISGMCRCVPPTA